MGRDVSYFNASFIVKGNTVKKVSQDSVHKLQFLKRKA